jgi:hypothetical protein
VVSAVSGARTGLSKSSSIIGVDKICLFYVQCPNRHWGVPAQPPIERVSVASSPGLKRPGREAGHLP